MTAREMIEIVSEATSEIKRLSAALDEQTSRANHHEERASEYAAEVERLKRERDALLRDIDKAWSALDQSDLIVITDEEYRLGHDAPYNAMAGLMLNVRAALGEVQP